MKVLRQTNLAICIKKTKTAYVYCLIFFQYNGQIKKFITDSNAVAQEKGLEAALAYVENCDSASKVVSDCVEGVVMKCVAAPKTKTKDLANQIVLMFCEIEAFEKTIEELIKGMN